MDGWLPFFTMRPLLPLPVIQDRPPVDPKFRSSTPTNHEEDDISLRDFALIESGREGSLKSGQGSIRSDDDGEKWKSLLSEA